MIPTGETYAYDANENMITRVEGGLTYTQVFDAENRLVSVTVSGQTTTFQYDGDGNLVKKVKPNGDKTLYIGGVYEVDKTGTTVTRTVTYYPAAGAMRIGSTLYYTLKDHLGSTSVVTNSTGVVVGEDRFYPFGETRFTTGTMYTDKLFTGQQEITGLGIYNYRARFYSPKLGRFLSADSIVPNLFNPQDLNRFSYVRNNPLKYTDPTGHCSLSGHWIPDSDPACQWASNNQGSLSGSGNGGFGGGTTTTGGGLGCYITHTCPQNTPSPTTTPTLTPPPSLTPTTQSTGAQPNPMVSIAGVLLFIQMDVLDVVLTIGVVGVFFSLPVTGPIGLAGELVLLPLDFLSLNFTIFGAEMVFTGRTNFDPLPLLP